MKKHISCPVLIEKLGWRCVGSSLRRQWKSKRQALIPSDVEVGKWYFFSDTDIPGSMPLFSGTLFECLTEAGK